MVGRTFNYDSDDNLLWVGKTLLNSSIEITAGSEDVVAGPGAALQLVYYHTGALNLTQEEAQFSLPLLAKTIGSSIVTGANIWTEETVELTAGAGTVEGTPIATASGTIYGWAELEDGTTERFTFSGSDFNLVGQSTGYVCVRYYEQNNAARQITVNANIVPSVVRTVVEAQLFSGDSTDVSASSLIGKVLIEVPKLQLDGSATINLTTTGVSSTPIRGRALATNLPGCSVSGVYATITEVVDTANWYDNVTLIVSATDPVELTHEDTHQLVIWAVPTNGDAPFLAPLASLDYSSDTVGVANVSETGLITTVSAGSALISVSISDKPVVQTTVAVEVSAGD